MEMLFQVCAGLGGSLLLLQFIASLVGLSFDHDFDVGHDADADSDHADSSWFFGLLTLRAILSAITFFGLGGMCGLYYELQPQSAFLLAVLSGGAVLYGVGSLVNWFRQLKSDGTPKLQNAIGRTAIVYLRIPAGGQLPGKITVHVHQRSMEVEAYSQGGEIPTGSTVRVVAVRPGGSVDVEAYAGA